MVRVVEEKIVVESSTTQNCQRLIKGYNVKFKSLNIYSIDQVLSSIYAMRNLINKKYVLFEINNL